MKVLVVGGGGREHAIVSALSRSPGITRLWCAPGNGGIASLAECVNIRATDVATMVGFAVQNGVDFAVIAPDDPLALGMVDAMEQAGIPAFGPRKDAAVIESSKIFSKDMMKKYGIPTAGYRVFTSMEDALSYVSDVPAPLVVKADGLALGKGVVVAQTTAEAEAAVRSMMEDRIFGESGARILIEECLTGPEVTVLCFADGKTVRPMPSSQDHKRALDGDRGPNTGGMGAISPSRNYTPELASRCMEEIFLPTLRAMNSEGRPFKGVLYFGLMLTQDGPKVIEYNARFGDPEAQAVLSLLKTDLLQVMLAVTEERLADLEIEWEEGAACCLVLASGGYPGSYETGYPIEGLDSLPPDITVYHAGTRISDGRILTSGGRVLGVTAVADTLDGAIGKAYSAALGIRFEAMQYRKDIGRI